MADTFDPYFVWLGIPQSQQPVNHYRLLGIELFESDLNVIKHAADRQMTRIRQFQNGRHKVEAQRLLKELSAARTCLLNAESRTRYDKRLAASNARSSPVEVVEDSPERAPTRSRGAASQQPRRNQPTVAPGPPRRTSGDARPAAASLRTTNAARATDATDAADFTFEVSPDANRPQTSFRGAREPSDDRSNLLFGAAIAGILVVAVGVGVWIASMIDSGQPSSPQEVVESTPPVVERPPSLAAIGNQFAKQEQPWDWILDAEAPEGFRTGDLRFQLEKSPPGMQVDPRKGRMTWLPGPDAVRGPHEVVVKVQIEGQPKLTASRTFRITVEPREVPAPTPKPTPKPTPVAEVVAPNTTEFVEFVPTSRKVSQHWRYTTEEPQPQGPRKWFNVTYNDATWRAGPGGFGEGTANGVAAVRTTWSTPQIWLRREFQITESILIDPHVMLFHDDDAEVYINGTKVFDRPGSTAAYLPLRLDRFGRQTLRWGRNMFAVTCKHTDGSRFIDVGLATRRLPLAPAQQTALDAAGKALHELDSMLLITSDNAQAVLRIEGDSKEPPALVFQQARHAAEAAHFRVGGVISIGRNFTEADMTEMVKSPAFSINNSVLFEKCDIAERAFDQLGSVKELRVLVLKKTKWPRQAAKNFASLTLLDTLDLSYTSVTDEEMQYLAGLKEITQLDLSYTTVSDRGLAQLSGLTKLKTLGVFGTRVTVHGAKHALPNVEARGAGQR